MEGQRWVREPKQERARLSFQRVLDAGAQLLAESGFDGFSIAEVCRLAAVSPGALYGRVAGKDELFLAVHQRELARMTASAHELFADSPVWHESSTPEFVLAVFRALGEHYRENAALLRAFILRAAVDQRALEQGARANASVQARVVQLLGTRAADFHRPDIVTALPTAYRLAANSIGWHVAFSAEPDASPDADFEAWIDQVAAACQSYLLAPTALLAPAAATEQASRQGELP